MPLDPRQCPGGGHQARAITASERVLRENQVGCLGRMASPRRCISTRAFGDSPEGPCDESVRAASAGFGRGPVPKRPIMCSPRETSRRRGRPARRLWVGRTKSGTPEGGPSQGLETTRMGPRSNRFRANEHTPAIEERGRFSPPYRHARIGNPPGGRLYAPSGPSSSVCRLAR
jgi:hypothetical protein